MATFQISCSCHKTQNPDNSRENPNSSPQDDPPMKVTLITIGRSNLNRNWILLDNQSTIYIFCNRCLLKKIWRSITTLTVHIQNGSSQTNLIGDLDGYDSSVWFKERGIVDIISLARVKINIMSISTANMLTTSLIKVLTKSFSPKSSHGLYYNDIENNSVNTFVTTVKTNSKRYTYHQYIPAKNARKLQQIIGYPTTKIFLTIVDNKLIQNFPVFHKDNIVAENIFGPTIVALKCKKVCKKTHGGETKAHPRAYRINGCAQERHTI